MKKPLVFVKLLNEGDTGSEEDRYNRHHNMNVGATTRGVFKAYAFFLFKKKLPEKSAGDNLGWTTILSLENYKQESRSLKNGRDP